MSDEFSAEPLIGHRVEAKRHVKESPLGNVLDDVAESYGIERRNRERIRIKTGNVASDETNSVSIGVETFERIIEWYEESNET